MRSIWIIISTLAIAHLLALLGFVGWLGSTGRLSGNRVERVRTLFASTVEREDAEAAERARQEEEARAAEAARAAELIPPLTAERKLAAASEEERSSELLGRRFMRDTMNLVNTLTKDREALEQERAAFAREVEAFNQMRRRIAEEEGSEQFQKAVALYQSLKPDQARSMLASLIAQGQTDQVVAYLDALPARNSSRVLAAFQADEPALAADLLERLRKRGMEVSAATPPPPMPPSPPAAPEG